MTVIKYFTGVAFDNKSFANMLNSAGISARAVSDGVFLDIERFNSVKPSCLPLWAYLNKSGINSPLRTRPATREELEGEDNEEG
jgi:hypothetical protein